MAAFGSFEENRQFMCLATEHSSFLKILRELIRKSSKEKAPQKKTTTMLSGIRTKFSGVRTKFSGVRTKFSGIRTHQYYMYVHVSQLREH